MKRIKSGNLNAIPYLLPFLAVYVIFTVFPMIKGAEMSLYHWTLIKKLEFVGLDNYKHMVTDPAFWGSLWNTTFFVIISTPTMIIVALVLALISNMNSRLKTFYRGAFFLPHILSVSVISFLTIFMLKPYTGFVNSFLHFIGISWEPFWLANPNLAWISVLSATVWWTVGFNMLLYLAALQEIPDSLYEAGRIDGATSMQLFRYVTLPLLFPITRVILLLQIIASYKIFAQIFIITNGGPGTKTRPIIQYIYETGFKQNNLGYAATMSYGLFAILLALAMLQIKMRTKEGRN